MHRLLPCLTALLLSAGALGHHSAGVSYDVDTIAELEGNITEITWRNPHVYFTLEAADGRTWSVESNSVSILDRMGVTSGMVEPGDSVRIAGWPGWRAGRLFALNMLLPGGTELLLWPGMTARWADESVGSASSMAADGNSSPEALGVSNDIFRVWSSNMANPASFPLFLDVAGATPDYPLTAAARTARSSWDPVEDNPFLSCDPVGMPRVMGQPYPMEFINDGERILLRIELHDVVRTIRMSADEAAAGEEPANPLGHSRGHWDGGTLVVRTTNLNWPFFDQSGIPQSASAEILERFTPSTDGTRLEYVLTVTDPATFTEPVTLEKYWTWRPDAQVRPFDCNTDYSP